MYVPCGKSTFFPVCWDLKCSRPQNSRLINSELLNDIKLIRIEHMVEEQHEFFNLVDVVFECSLINVFPMYQFVKIYNFFIGNYFEESYGSYCQK